MPSRIDFQFQRIFELIRSAVLANADPRAVTQARLSSEPIHGPVDVLALGKAAARMAEGASAAIGVPAGGLIVTNQAVEQPPKGFEVLLADHPAPTDRSVEAARRVLDFVARDRHAPRLLVLLSGGASATLTLPRDTLPLPSLAGVAKDLMGAGASIHEINAVRKHTERLKGGGLARASRADRITVLVLSDVVGDRLDVIGSGPLAPDPTTFADALAVLEKYGLRERHEDVAAYLDAGVRGTHDETAKPGDSAMERIEHVVLAAHDGSARAASMIARDEGYEVETSLTHLEGTSGGWAERLLALARQPAALPTCHILAGEPTVNVHGAAGVGGPSQEVAARWLLGMAESPAPGPRALMTFSTDGIDGPTPNAGGQVLWEHTKAARTRVGWVRDLLREHDSSGILEELGAALRTGPTGTNVNHVAVLLCRPDVRERTAAS